jgi:transposase-like protein
MKMCPICKKSRRELQKIVKGKGDKRYLITFCGTCLYNFDIDDSNGGTMPSDIMDKPGIPIWDGTKWLQ